MPPTHAFTPDYAVPPGATLLETLESLGMSQSELSLRTGLAEKTISQIVNGVAPITHETALKLESVLGVPASFWNNLETNYRGSMARIAEAERLKGGSEWLKKVPVKTLIERGFVPKEQDKGRLQKAVLAFFGVSDVTAWDNVWLRPDAAFRRSRSFCSRPELVATWLRMGQVLAARTQCQPYDPQRFRKVLCELRALTIEPPQVIQRALEQKCAEAGVAVVFVREIPRAGVSGATMWLSKDKAMIQLSLRYKNDASLWFTLFHECGHVLMHGKKDVYIEDGQAEDAKELEAERFAQDFLIPRQHARELPHLKTKVAIRQFAESVGIAPGIVVGRLQHEGWLDPSFCNDLKQKLNWAD